MIPDAAPGGRPHKTDKRDIVESTLYVLRAGCAWRLLPHDFRPWPTVYYYLRRWQREGVWARVHHALVVADREREGREGLVVGRRHRQPDRQDGGSKAGSRGYDAGMRINGRKRQILTDTDGRLLAVEVHAADVQDRAGAKGVLKRSRARFPFVERFYADGGYASRLVQWAQEWTHVALEIVNRTPGARGFVVIRRRWGVERTFAWIMKCRRLLRDDEQFTAVAETLITIAVLASCVRRAAGPFSNTLLVFVSATAAKEGRLLLAQGGAHDHRRLEKHYTTKRPHSTLGYRPAAPEAIVPMDRG